MHKTKDGTSYWVNNNDLRSPVIVMIHGFRGTHHGLELIAKNLQQYQVIIPDIPGFGETKPLDDKHSLDNYVKWLHEFITELQLDKPPVLLGHSFGSIITSNFAAKYPDTISKLILENPIGAPALSGPRSILTKFALMYYWLGSMLPEPIGTRLLSSKLVVKIMSKTMTKTRVKKTQKFIDSEHLQHFSTFANKRVVNEAFITSIENNVRSAAPLIKIPTLLIVGDKDDITPIEKQRELFDMFSNASFVVIKNVGHLTHYETPEQVASAIISFLK